VTKGKGDVEATVGGLKEAVREFSERRDWDQFHNAKDLAIGITTEAAELLEMLRFKSEKEVEELMRDKAARREVERELADVLFFVLRTAQRYDIDLASALEDKLKLNASRYPVSKAKGSNRKYNERWKGGLGKDR